MEYLLYWLFYESMGCSIARNVIPTLSFGRTMCIHRTSLKSASTGLVFAVTAPVEWSSRETLLASSAS